jgi:hypothetical protein
MQNESRRLKKKAFMFLQLHKILTLRLILMRGMASLGGCIKRGIK